MLNCSTCHRKKPIEHFYRYAGLHTPWLPSSATPEDADALARLIADGIVSATPGRTTQHAARATMTQVNERLATVGRPPETENQRARREAAQQAARAAEEEAARRAAEAPRIPKWVKWGAFVAGGLVGALFGFNMGNGGGGGGA